MSNFRVVIHHRISALHRDTSAGVWGGGGLNTCISSCGAGLSGGVHPPDCWFFLVALGLAALACRNGVG